MAASCDGGRGEVRCACLAPVVNLALIYECTLGIQTETINPLTGTLKLHSNGSLYRKTVIGVLAIDGWAVTQSPSPLLAVPNVTAHPSTASVPTSYQGRN